MVCNQDTWEEFQLQCLLCGFISIHPQWASVFTYDNIAFQVQLFQKSNELKYINDAIAIKYNSKSELFFLALLKFS
jgi:hypothetical protein